MLDVSSLIEFLLKLLRDDAAQAEFVRDPQGVLAQAGLSGVTAQDICDAQPILADHSGVAVHHPLHHPPLHHPPAHHHDPVHQIQHVIKTHTVDKQVIVKHDAPQYNTYNEYNQHYAYADNSIHADTAIVDSFNQDNDGVDNKGGVISHSNVANGDQTDFGNSAESTTLTDSLNTDAHHDTAIVDSGNDSSDHSATVANSGNDTSSHATVDVNGSFNPDQSMHIGPLDDAPTALHAVDAPA
jgi:hypothetical protein